MYIPRHYLHGLTSESLPVLLDHKDLREILVKMVLMGYLDLKGRKDHKGQRGLKDQRGLKASRAILVHKDHKGSREKRETEEKQVILAQWDQKVQKAPQVLAY
jgi:hypothetical protein